MKRISTIIWLSLVFAPVHSQDNASKLYQGSKKDSIAIMQGLTKAKSYYRSNDFNATILLCDSLFTRSLMVHFNRGAGEACFLKARGLNKLGRKEKAISTYKQASEYFDSIQEYARLASTYNNLGLILKASGKFREAIEIGEQAFQFVTNTSEDRLKFHILNNLGNSYQQLALFKKAGSAYFEALQILKNENSSDRKDRMEAEVYINLGIIYLEQNLYDKSLEIYNKAEKILQNQQLQAQLATLYHNISIVHLENEDFELAEKYLEQSLSLHEELDDELGVAISLDGLGSVYLEQKYFSRSIKMHKHAIEELQRHDATFYLPSAYLGLGKAYLAVENSDHAILSLMKGLQISLKSGAKLMELKIYESLIESYKSIGELEMAVLYYDLHAALSNELSNQQIGRHIGQLELQELLDKRDNALKSMETETAALHYKMNKKNGLLLLSVCFILVLVVLSSLVFRQQRLKSLNRQMSLEQKILRSQLNPHFIFNALGAIQHYIGLKATKDATQYLSNFSKLMRSVLNGSRTSTNPLSIELETMNNYLDLQSLRFSGSFRHEILVDDRLETELIDIPSLILQPLVENAVEHGLLLLDCGKISIKVEQMEASVKITVKDDGIGGIYSENEIKPTSSSGLGISITRERLALLNRNRRSKIEFKLINRSTENPLTKGTKAILQIPLN